MLGGIKTTISSDMGQNTTAVNCGITTAIAGQYSNLALPVNNAGVCTATVTMNANTNKNIAGKTVIMTFDSATGLFTHNQAITGGTVPANYLSEAWR
jgi:hypothetical protein